MTDAQARNLGALLRSARERAGLSLRELTAVTGLPTTTLKYLEDGRSADPSPDSLMRVAEALKIDPARIDRISGDHLARSLPGQRTYFRSKNKATEEQLDQIEAFVAGLLKGEQNTNDNHNKRGGTT